MKRCKFFREKVYFLSTIFFFDFDGVVSESSNNIGEVSVLESSNTCETIGIDDDSVHFLVVNFLDYFLFYTRVNGLLELHLFWVFFFSLLIFFFGFFLIFVSNPIYSVISLIVVYLAASFLLITFGIHFLAVIFILVYLGAVIVLFLFIVMMLNIKVQYTIKFLVLLPFLFFLVIFFSFFNSDQEFFFKKGFFFDDLVLGEDFGFLDFVSQVVLVENYLSISYLQNLNFQIENLRVLSFLLYTFFFMEFLLCSYILLVAMLGCIAITLIRDSKKLKKTGCYVAIIAKEYVL